MKVKIQVECDCEAKEIVPIGEYREKNVITHTQFENFKLQEGMFYGFRLTCKKCNANFDIE